MTTTELWQLALIVGTPITGIAVGVIVACAVQRLLSDRPPARTTARDRLLARNPALALGDDVDRPIRWSVESRRVRFGWLTTLAVTVAVLVATTRPTVATAPTDDR